MHERSIFPFLRMLLSFEMNFSTPRSRSDWISRRMRASTTTTVLVCVVINNSSYPTVKNNTAYHCYRQVACNNFIAIQKAGFAEKPATLKQPEQFSEGVAANQNTLLSQLILRQRHWNVSKITRLNHKTVTTHKRNHMTISHDQVKTRVPKNYLMVLEALKTSQSPNNYAINNRLEHLKKMRISKSHDDLWV